MGLHPRVASLTPAEYLQIERTAQIRHEYFKGEMFAMSGGSPQHSLIKMNVGRELSTKLKGRPCTAFDSDLRIRTSPNGLYTYPDLSVVCGELQFDDDLRDTVINPTLLVEVLSGTTEAYDRGKKFEHYRRIASLALLSQSFDIAVLNVLAAKRQIIAEIAVMDHPSCTPFVNRDLRSGRGEISDALTCSASLRTLAETCRKLRVQPKGGNRTKKIVVGMLQILVRRRFSRRESIE